MTKGTIVNITKTTETDVGVRVESGIMKEQEIDDATGKIIKTYNTLKVSRITTTPEIVVPDGTDYLLIDGIWYEPIESLQQARELDKMWFKE